MTDLNYIGYVLACGDVYFKKYHLLLMNKANHQLGITMNKWIALSQQVKCTQVKRTLKCFDEWIVISIIRLLGPNRFIIPDSECLRMSSTSSMDHYLIDLSWKQVLGGNKVGHGLVAEAWTEMVKMFNGTEMVKCSQA